MKSGIHPDYHPITVVMTDGTKFVTRDFLIFAKGKVVLLSARTPATNAAALPGLIDHVARSLQLR